MTQIWNTHPSQAALKLRLRDSNPARSKKLAEVQATKEQVNAARRRGTHAAVSPSGDKPETLRATIDIPIPVESQLDVWLDGLMRSVSNASGVALTHHSAPTGLAVGSWQAVRDFTGNWSGRVIVQCACPSDLYKLQSAVHCQGISIEGHRTTITLGSDYVDLGSYYGGGP